MTPEAQYLLMALHEAEGRNDAALAALSPEAWQAVATLAIQQHIPALLASRPGLPFPPAVAATLRAASMHGAIRNLQRQAALRELAAAVAPHQVVLVALKGMHLASLVYDSPALRPMVDIDVLVDAQDLDVVTAAARALGYVPFTDDLSTHHAPALIRGRMTIELHHHIDPRLDAAPVPMASARERLAMWPLAPNLRVFCPEDLLVHTALHAIDAHAMETGLRAVCDIRAILARHGTALDADRVAATASAWRGTRAVQLGLALSRRYLGACAPQLRAMADAVPDAVVTTAMLHAFDRYRPTSEAAARFADGGWRERLHLLADRVRAARAEPVAVRVAGLLRRHGRWLLSQVVRPARTLDAGLVRRRALRAWLDDEPSHAGRDNALTS